MKHSYYKPPITKPILRETAVWYRGRVLLVELKPRTMRLWQKGLHRDKAAVEVDYQSVLELGYKAAAAERAAAKKESNRAGRRRAG